MTLFWFLHFTPCSSVSIDNFEQASNILINFIVISDVIIKDNWVFVKNNNKHKVCKGCFHQIWAAGSFGNADNFQATLIVSNVMIAEWSQFEKARKVTKINW